MALKDLQKDPMMAHLLNSLEQGRDIGHYGRLVFVMIARHFLPEKQLLDYLMKDRDVDEQKARSLLAQVEARDYIPPKRERSRTSPSVPIPPIPINAMSTRAWICRKRFTTKSRVTMRGRLRAGLLSRLQYLLCPCPQTSSIA